MHEVYTPVPSVTAGGHFYTYDSLHLSEFSRLYDRKDPFGLTNQEHPSSQTMLSIMVLVIAKGEQRSGLFLFLVSGHFLMGFAALRRKPLHSLCRMVIKPELYMSTEVADNRLFLQGHL